MKIFPTAFCLLIGLAILLAGAPAASAASPGFLYALSENATTGSQIFGYLVDEPTGTLTALPGFPVPTGGNGLTAHSNKRLVVDQANARLYALNRGSSTVSAFSMNRSTGALTAMPFSPLGSVVASPLTLAVHPSGSPLLVADGNGDLASFNVSSTAATPAAGSPYAFAGFAFTSAFSQDGGFFYTGGNFGTAFVGLSVDPTTGIPAPLAGSPYDTGVFSPQAYTTDPAGRLFLTNANSGDVRVYTTATGVPTEVAGSPFAISGLTQAVDGVLHPGGFYILADRADNRVGVYQISGSGNATTMAAVAGSPFASGGTVADALALTQSGRFLFVGNGTTRNITTFLVNPTTGVLSTVTTQPADTMGGADFLLSSLAYFQPESSLAYVFNSDPSGNRIFGYRVNETYGTLAPIFGFPKQTGGNGAAEPAMNQQLAFDGTNNRLFAVNSTTLTVSAYSVDSASGFLTELPFSPFPITAANRPQLSLHPSGSPLLVNDAAGGQLQSFVISDSAATVATGSPFSTGSARPFSTVFSQDGQSVYSGGNTGTTFAGFQVASTGFLTPLTGSPYDTGSSFPLAAATDAQGRLFLTNSFQSEARAYTTSNGVPTEVTGSPFAAPVGSVLFGALHPGGFYMTSDFPGNQVFVQKIAGTGPGTTLLSAPGSPFSAGATAAFTNKLVFNAAGTYLFALNASSRNITSFLVDSLTGALLSPTITMSDLAGGTGAASGMIYIEEGSIVPPTPTPTPTPQATPTPIVDQTRPDLKIRGRQTIETLRKRVVIRGTATDASGIPELDVKARGAEVIKTKVGGNGSFKVVLRVTKEQGRVIVKLRATDSAGNRSKQSKFRILRR